MPSDAYTPQRHALPAKLPGQSVEVFWNPGIRSFCAEIGELGATTRYGTSPRQYVRPEQLFTAIRGQWAWNEPDEQHVHVLLCMDRAAGPQEIVPPPWQDGGRGR